MSSSSKKVDGGKSVEGCLIRKFDVEGNASFQDCSSQNYSENQNDESRVCYTRCRRRAIGLKGVVVAGLTVGNTSIFGWSMDRSVSSWRRSCTKMSFGIYVVPRTIARALSNYRPEIEKEAKRSHQYRVLGTEANDDHRKSGKHSLVWILWLRAGSGARLPPEPEGTIPKGIQKGAEREAGKISVRTSQTASSCLA